MQKYDIHGKGIPKLINADLLKEHLKSMATKEMYEMSKKIRRTGEPNPDATHAVNTSNAEIPKNYRFELIPLLEKCFPNLTFLMAGYFLYGPGDGIDEHTNSNDPSDVLYITYATGESSFSYRYSQDEELIKTEDAKDDITLRAFTLTSKPPYFYHKVDCKSGYRISIGLRYAQL